jgi:hypothetical protein
MTSPGCTLVGTLTDPSGNPLAGTVTLSLSNYGPVIPLISGSNLFAALTTTVVAASNGSFSLPFYGNYQITPANTYYTLTVLDPTSNTTFNLNVPQAAYQFLTSGTFDISTISPITTYPNPVVGPTNNLNFQYEEVPAGTINGTNATFTLDYTPSPISSINLFQNGIRQTRGTAFTITGNTITYASHSIPLPGDTHICFYTH